MERDQPAEVCLMGSFMSYSIYQFTDHELDTIHQFMELSPFGPVHAFRWYKGLKEDAQLRTGDVEDFAISFYTQYNRQRSRTY
jgi:hypothetical protein